MAENEAKHREALPEPPAALQRTGAGGDAPDGQSPDGVVLTAEQARRRRSRSVAIAVVLGALCLLFYVVTIVKLGPAVLIRPL